MRSGAKKHGCSWMRPKGRKGRCREDRFRGGLSFTGCSLMADPRGEVIAQAPVNEEAVEVREIDVALARDKMITERNHLFQDRRPREYSLLTEPA